MNITLTVQLGWGIWTGDGLQYVNCDVITAVAVFQAVTWVNINVTYDKIMIENQKKRENIWEKYFFT